ncbi:hypothetical protein DNK03_13875 [Brucella anthropi]|uniref:hypothetical protein n=1 Tax=Brucella anthropi TaxID=529 RepID=UPI000DEC606E|nr:hypothetical protein [Brucella anthropi]RCI79297.1 hypothetical protein DNK03_13875 [Brucella anthropi]
MPTISSSQVPPPKSWEEFEEICLSAAKHRWDSSKFFGNGRKGQAQNGVDIWGHDSVGEHIGVQCKNTLAGISLSVVKDEIANAAGFKPKLDHLYIATTAPRDASLQRDVRLVSTARKAAGNFQVDVLFWDDVVGDLALKDSVFFKHYPQFKIGLEPGKAHDQQLYEEYLQLMRSDGVIGFIDKCNMAGFSFPSERLDPLRIFVENWNAPEREFNSSQIDAVRLELWKKARDYVVEINRNTFPANGPGWITVPPDWEDNFPDRFSRVVKELHGMAGEIVEIHGRLVRTAKAVLLATN